MAVTVELRTTTVDDLAFLLDVFADTRPLEVEALGGRAAADAFLAWQWEAKRRGARAAHRTVHEQIIVADGHDTGYMVWAVDEPDGMHVVDIAVREGSRRGGVGTAALGELLARADLLGATVSLDVEHLNPARHLYERIGFVEVARDERSARMERSRVS